MRDPIHSTSSSAAPAERAKGRIISSYPRPATTTDTSASSRKYCNSLLAGQNFATAQQCMPKPLCCSVNARAWSTTEARDMLGRVGQADWDSDAAGKPGAPHRLHPLAPRR